MRHKWQIGNGGEPYSLLEDMTRSLTGNIICYDDNVRRYRLVSCGEFMSDRDAAQLIKEWSLEKALKFGRMLVRINGMPTNR